MNRRTFLSATVAAPLPQPIAFADMETLEQRKERLIAELSAVLRQLGGSEATKGKRHVEPSLKYAAFAISYDAIRSGIEDRPWSFYVDTKGEFILLQPEH